MENKQLAMETLIEANNYIVKVLAGIEYIVENFLAGREDLALGSFVNLVDGIKWLVDVIELTRPLLDQIGVDFTSDNEVEQIMKEMVEAFENRDYVLVGDLLNYELKPFIEDWKQKFEIIEGRI